jgi:RHS repeat-associated protein
MLYRYDALQRIVASQSATVNLSNGMLATAANNAYSQKWTYDPNGNIRGHNDVTTPNSTRVGTTAGTFADNLTYAYSDSPTAIGGLGQANKTHNRLLKVTDLNTTQPTGQNGSNTLTYDNIGNLITNVSSISTEGTSTIAWTVYGKVASVSRLISGVTRNTTYYYDERDNRLGEVNGHILLPPGNTLPTETWYIRDAQGNVLSVYTKNTAGQLVQTELPLYGSSRVGMQKVTRFGPLNGTKPPRVIPFQRRRGDKFFEISNHLGNVITTVSDHMLGEGTTALTYYQAQVKTYADYYPFGMEMQNRTSSSPNYRYGFNGKEKDQAGEFSAGQTHYDYGFRIYNPVWGKFLSVDPLTASYSMLTPYQFASNTPIQAIDLDGLEAAPSDCSCYEGQQETTTGSNPLSSPTGVGAMSSITQDWIYHEGGVNGSAKGWMKPNDYASKVLDPLADGIDSNNGISTDASMDFAFSRKGDIDYLSLLHDYSKERAEFKESNPTVSGGQQFVPVWGSSKQSYLDFQAGNYGLGLFNAGMAVSDVFLLKSIVVNGGKFVAKGGLAGSRGTWSGWRGWYGRNGFASRGDVLHHTIFEANGVRRGTSLWWNAQQMPWNLTLLKPTTIRGTLYSAQEMSILIHGQALGAKWGARKVGTSWSGSASGLGLRLYYGTNSFHKSGSMYMLRLGLNEGRSYFGF